MENLQLKNVIEAALLAAGRPLSADELRGLFGADDQAPSKQDIRDLIAALQADYEDRGIDVKEVASGFRIQVRASMAPWLTKLWEERAPRYSRALMETLAIIAYRQPVTRGEVEDIRGVSVTTNIIRTLLERGWVRVVGHRDVPGKPAMFGTTRDFLDYFGLKTLDELPTLEALKDFENFNVQLELPEGFGPESEVATLLDAGLANAEGDEAAVLADQVETVALAGVATLEPAEVLPADDQEFDAPVSRTANVVPLKTR